MTAADFFYANAGWSYNPATETSEQGRRKGAAALAEAEQWARSENMTIAWEPDCEIGSHVCEPETCETATLYDADGRVVAALGCIDDATNDYRRVVAAELALEALHATRADAALRAESPELRALVAYAEES